MTFKQLVPVGSITGDPIGMRRYMVVDPQNSSTSAAETICISQDGSTPTPQPFSVYTISELPRPKERGFLLHTPVCVPQVHKLDG
jgi:hypothetical protein